MKVKKVISVFLMLLIVIIPNSTSATVNTEGDWVRLDTKTEVSLNKSWTVKFNSAISIDYIDGIVIEKVKEKEFIAVDIELIGEREVKVTPRDSYEPLSQYEVKIFLANKQRYIMPFTTTNASTEETKDIVKVVEVKEMVDPFNPQVNISELISDTTNIFASELYKGEELINANSIIEDGIFKINSSPIKENILLLNSSYQLRVANKSGELLQVNFETSGMTDINSLDPGDKIFIPADPNKGFEWPYYLVLPREKSEFNKSYLIMDTANTGSDNNFDNAKSKVFDWLDYNDYAKELNFPFIMPVFPRPKVYYYKEDSGHNSFYSHAFDRDLARWDYLIQDEEVKYNILNDMEEAGIAPEKFINFDEQVVKMIEHAYDYLKGSDYEVAEKKVIFTGYSASGTFSNRFTMLQPDYVKMVISGATMDDIMLPISHYKGENLIFPIGTYDYEEITGRKFNLEKLNSIPILVHMGADDTNNTLKYSDAYGDIERNIIKNLWGESVRPRADYLRELYGESGGKGVFILDKGIKHSRSKEMEEYAIKFIKANLNSDVPVYPDVENIDQLDALIFK